MDHLHKDVIIVGGGPAGLMLAKNLSGSGLNVLLVERRNTIKKLDNSIFATFDDVIQKYHLEKTVVQRCPRAALYGPTSAVRFSFSEKPLAIVDLDRWAETLRLDCEVRCRTTIVSAGRVQNGIELIDAHGNRYSAKMVVDCTGKDQTLAPFLGILRSDVYCYCYTLIMEGCDLPDPGEASLNADFRFANGGGWIYPLSKTRCQVGLGDFVPIPQPYQEDIAVRIKKMVKEYKPYAGWLRHARIVSESRKEAPITSPHRRMIAANFLSMGDAAGQTTPFLAEGIRPAFEMAETAKNVILSAFATDDFTEEALAPYEKIWREKFGKSYVWSMFIRHLWMHEFSNADIDDLVKNLQDIDSEEFYSFIRCDVRFKTFIHVMDFKLVDDIILNFIDHHLPIYEQGLKASSEKKL